MKFVIQRVTHAEVCVNQETIGKIGKGFLVFIGVSQDDTQELADKLIRKLINLRIFEDEQGKTNLSLQDVSGELLLISQFTLYADCKRETGLPLPKPAILYWPMIYMNTSLQNAGNKFQMSRQAPLAPI